MSEPIMSKSENEELSWGKDGKQAGFRPQHRETERHKAQRSVCQQLSKEMPSLYRFIQAALATLQQEQDSSPTPAISTFSGHGTQLCHSVEELNEFSTRPVQIAQGEERQAKARKRSDESNEEIKERQRRCEISTNAKSQQKLLKEGFKEEMHYAQDHIDQAEKEAVAQNHSEQAETESTETEEDF